ncbi:MAG TPA: DHHA1 domain-containing protein [Patescibacteria group bacterium]|nr:DHHA1 domain-containing protein [Patescibacteria group bacterium]
MLTEKQISEIKSHLEKAQNPIFFFDNDPDGLCSFLLLQRAYGKGKGVPIKSFPEFSAEYFRKVNELNADYIFILDKPVVSDAFFEEARQVNIPVVWIDHHDIGKNKVPEFVNYYNPFYNKTKSNEPVTYLCYRITEKKEDLWIAIIGCICDNFIPEFYKKFQKDYPDLSTESHKALGIYYDSQIGKIAQMLNFGLKDRVSNVISMLKFLMKAKTPYDVLNETPENKEIHKRFEEVDKKYRKLLEKAVDSDKSKNLLFFQYGGDLSISADIANALMYRFPKKTIAVARDSGGKTSISLRGKGIKKTVLNILPEFENATGGGHEDAVGVKVMTEDIEKFRKRLEEETEK